MVFTPPLSPQGSESAQCDTTQHAHKHTCAQILSTLLVDMPYNSEGLFWEKSVLLFCGGLMQFFVRLSHRPEGCCNSDPKMELVRSKNKNWNIQHFNPIFVASKGQGAGYFWAFQFWAPLLLSSLSGHAEAPRSEANPIPSIATCEVTR